MYLVVSMERRGSAKRKRCVYFVNSTCILTRKPCEKTDCCHALLLHECCRIRRRNQRNDSVNDGRTDRGGVGSTWARCRRSVMQLLATSLAVSESASTDATHFRCGRSRIQLPAESPRSLRNQRMAARELRRDQRRLAAEMVRRVDSALKAVSSRFCRVDRRWAQLFREPQEAKLRVVIAATLAHPSSDAS